MADIVVGDILELSVGDILPADCILVESSNLQYNNPNHILERISFKNLDRA